MPKYVKLILMHIGILAVVAGYYILIKYLNTSCLIRYIIHYPCPTCGMSRAIVSLFKLDWRAYVTYNVMALPMVASILVALHFNKKKWIVSIAVVVAVVNMIYYIVRMVQGTII